MLCLVFSEIILKINSVYDAFRSYSTKITFICSQE